MARDGPTSGGFRQTGEGLALGFLHWRSAPSGVDGQLLQPGARVSVALKKFPFPVAEPSGTLRRPDVVQDEAFAREAFLDRRDRVQVKYEMLRRHRIEGRPVT